MTEKRVIGVKPWWLRGTVEPSECLCAFQPIGALNISQSLFNINSRGTNDAAIGTTPTFASATGWTFDGATTYLTVGSGAIASAVPLSMIALFNSDDITTAYALMSIDREASAHNSFKILAAGATSNDPVTAVSTQAATARTATTGTGYVASTWYVGAGVFSTASLRTAFIYSKNSRATAYTHFGNKGSDTNSNTPASVDLTHIGATHDSSSLANFFLGKIGACAFYKVALTEKQVLEIALGMLELV
jgi:hypothetical protein